jgi:RNA polymerase sigma-70 factor, ECF subfamily
MPTGTPLIKPPSSGAPTRRPGECDLAGGVPSPRLSLRRAASSRWRWRETAAPRKLLDVESQLWWERLHGPEPVLGCAIAALHERLSREAAFQIRLRVRDLSDFPRSDIDDLALQAGGDALLVLLRKLEDYRGDSQFWTWARRFAALEASVCIRQRLGHDRVGISADPELVLEAPDPGGSVHDRAELRERVQILSDLIVGVLTPRQRVVMTAIAINGGAARTLADQLHTTPGAIYKSLHDARCKLRAQAAF